MIPVEHINLKCNGVMLYAKNNIRKSLLGELHHKS